MRQILEISKCLQYADKSRRFGDFYSWDCTVRKYEVSRPTGGRCVEMDGFGVFEGFEI